MVFNIGNADSRSVGKNSAGADATGSASGNSINRTTDTGSGSAASKAVEALKNMLAGDTFTGEITSINGNEVVLKMNSGLTLQALLLDNINLSVGQNLTFMVNENTNNKISIKPMSLTQQEAMLINRALEASNLSPNKNNIQLVQQLLKQGMPIDMNTLNTFSKELLKFPDANIDTLVRLGKLEIPITKENIAQFEAYKSYEHSISNELNNLSRGLGELMSDIATKGTPTDAAEFSQKLISILYKNESSAQTVPGNPAFETATGASAGTLSQGVVSPDMPAASMAQVDSKDVQNASDALSDLIKSQSESASNADGADINTASSGHESISKFLSASGRNQLLQNLLDTFGNEVSKQLTDELKNGNMSAKSLLENINQLIKDNPLLSKESLEKLFNSKEFGEAIKMLVRDRMRLTPDDIKNSDDIKDFYKRVREDVSKISEAVPDSARDSSFSKSLEGLKNNIDFMNDLNKNMSYFQMPVKFSGSDGNGELYVFTNKKNLANKTDNISALLHLDMENLGPLDVYIKLSGGSNVSTNFCLESEEMLDFVYSHIDQLNDRLEKLGYSVKFEMKVRDDANKLDFVQDFIDQKSGSQIPGQFIFDTRA